MNKAFVLGNLTRDPELRQTPNGQTVCTFSVATNRVFTDSSGQKQKQAEFHNIVVWGRQAEVVNQYLKKGNPVLVEGRIQTRNWQDQQGAKHWKTEIVLERFEFVGSRREGGTPNREGGIPDDGPSRSQAIDETPIVELPGDEEEVNMKDIPF